MKIFIFKPSDEWMYCGGGLVYVGNDFPKTVKERDNDCFNEKHRLFRTEAEVDPKDELFCWVLQEELDCPKPKKKGLIFLHYNWA